MLNEKLIGGEMMILTTGDLTSNRFVQRCVGMESLKPAMLQHELIFRNQVRELHRLYWTQKNLMNELYQKGLNTHAWRSSSWVAMRPMIKCKESTEAKNQCSELSCDIVNVESPKQLNGKPAEVMANHGIKFKLHDPVYDRKYPLFSNVEPEISKNNEFADATVKGSLGCGFVSIREKNMCHSANLLCNEVVDVGVSVANDVEENYALSGIRDPMHKIELQKTGFSDQVSTIAVGNETHQVSSISPMDVGHGGVLQEQNLFISSVGLGDSCVTTLVNHSRIKRRCKRVLVDLNIPHDLNDPTEDANHKFALSYLHDEIDQNGKKASCESGANLFSCHGQDSEPLSSLEYKLPFSIMKDKDYFSQVGGECFEKPVEGSTACNGEAYVLTKTDSFSSINSCKLDKMDADLPRSLMPAAVDGDNKRHDSNITSSNSTNPPQSVVQALINKVGSLEGSEEDTSSSHIIKCTSDGIIRKNMWAQGQNFKEPVAHSNTHYSVPTLQNYSQKNHFSIVKEDITIAAAAEALIGISLESCAIELPEVVCNDRDSQPLHSSDSFEFTTLQLSEVQSEVRFSSPNPSNVGDTEKIASRLRLRRGRGLRDFQKEILPGLATLARHEICEDLHNIGHKLRRTASRNARDIWLAPIRGQRSRLYSGCQRN